MLYVKITSGFRMLTRVCAVIHDIQEKITGFSGYFPGFVFEGTGSKPPVLSGWHLKILFNARKEPLITPNREIAR